jgi:hypothetical protein
MKRKILLLPVFLMAVWLILPNQLYAQEAKPERSVVCINLILDNGDDFRIEGKSLKVNTPSSNFLKTYKFKVPESAMEELDFGIYANKIIGVKLTLESGEVIIGVGFLNKAGILTFTVHSNGAGGFFPIGWF